MAKHVLRNLKILEVSSVDKGAGEGVRIMLMKRDDSPKAAWADGHLHAGWDEAFDGDVVTYCKREFSAEQRQAAEDKGHAMSGGGFPIENVSDLHNAIQAIGRAKNPAAAKAHIKEQAARLGRSDLIPDTWKRAPAKDDIDIAAIKVVEKEEPDMTLDELKKLINDQVAGVVTETIGKVVPEAVTKAVGEALAKAGGKFKPGDKGRMDSNPDSAHGDVAENDKAEEDCDAETKKALEIAKLSPEVRKIIDEADKNAKLVQKFMDKQALDEFAKRAVGMGLKKEDGVLLQKAYTGDAASQKVLEERMAQVAKASRSMEDTSVIFKEFGASNAGETEKGQSAFDQMQALARDLRKKDMTLTEAQAFAKVMTDPANAELAAQERQERMTKIHRLG